MSNDQRPLVVITDGLHPEIFEGLRQVSSLQVHPENNLNQEQLASLCPDLQALVVRSKTTVDAELIKACPNLRYVIRAGEGVDNIHLPTCAERKIAVSNTPGANNNAAAEQSTALILSLLRHVSNADASMKAGKWEKSKFTGRELRKRKVGILGLGRVGGTVAKHLHAFESEIYFFDPQVENAINPSWHKVETMEELFSKVSLVTCHIPLLAKTKGIITAELLKKLGPNGMFVNASRGGVVKQDELVAVLQENPNFRAALDVFESEPLADNSELRKLNNVILTPHLGASTEEAQLRVGEMVMDNLRNFFENKTTLNEVKLHA